MQPVGERAKDLLPSVLLTLTSIVQALSLEDVHWRLSTLPASCAGFTDRGTLEIGKAADVIVYDLERLACTPVEKVHDFPAGEWRRVQRGVGYDWVVVNGEVTVDHDRETGRAAGRLLRESRAGR